VRECVAQLARARQVERHGDGAVGHVTKEGAIAGRAWSSTSSTSVLYFEGDTHQSFRLVRAFKNRFGR